MIRRNSFLVAVLLAAMLGVAARAAAADAAAALAGADRLACAFLKGITAGFSAKGGVIMRPPLDPNTPGLTIAITDREKGIALLEEGPKETPGRFMLGPAGLTILARDPAGNVTLVTVYPQYSEASDNFYMVSSLHAGGMEPRMMQRYGLCRVAHPQEEAAPEAPAVPEQGHGHE